MGFDLRADVFRKALDNLGESVRFIDLDRRVYYWNLGAELITGLKGADMLGRVCGDGMCLHWSASGEPLCSPDCPVRLTLRDGLEREEKIFVRHHDGHLVPALLCVSAIRSPEGEVEGVMEILSDLGWSDTAIRRIEELNRMAMLDPLTEVGNRRYAEIAVEARLEEMRRYGIRFGLLFLDLDSFKQVNDAFGHHGGDDLLRGVACRLKACMRPFDTVARYGGDEFIVIAANILSPAELEAVAARLSAYLTGECYACGEGALRPRISIGATLSSPSDTLKSILGRADELMYRSKLAGSDRASLG